MTIITSTCTHPICDERVIHNVAHKDPRCHEHQTPEARTRNAKLLAEALKCQTCNGTGAADDCPSCGLR